MHLYCTLFDKNYITRGLAMQRSLIACVPDSTLIILCLDQITFDVLSALNLPQVELVSVGSLEEFDSCLHQIRPQREFVEFYWTCKSVLMIYILERFPSAQRITYLDSDLFFFSDQAPIESECAGSAIALTPHRFPPRLEDRLQFGVFNAGWVSVEPGDEGRRFVSWWRSRCFEWCKQVVEGDKFGDQKYLDRVPRLFSNVCAVRHLGANLAPWNLDGLEVKNRKGRVYVAGQQLLFFHFHALRSVFSRLYDSGLSDYGVSITADVRKYIYRPYLAALAVSERIISEQPERLRRELGEYKPSISRHNWISGIKKARRLVVNGAQVVWR